MPTDPLAIVLATSGSLFTLSAPDRPGLERAHRRTRRGKQRRTRSLTGAQARLFDRTGG
jgi:hypothetical protein